MADAAALVPQGAAASPIGEFDPPFWYGGIYEIRQSFTGGANDRASLGDALVRQLEDEGWTVAQVDERPGATQIDATKRDLAVQLRALGPPSTPEVEGTIKVRYRNQGFGALPFVSGIVGGAVGIAIAALAKPRR